MWSKSPPQTHQSPRVMLEAKPKLNLAAWFSIRGTLEINNHRYFRYLWINLPKWGENNFMIVCPNSKIWSSNSGRNEKDNFHKYERWKDQRPRYWIKQFQKIPSWGHFIRISLPPILRKISNSRSTDCYFSPWFITTVVIRSYNVCLISLNLQNKSWL